MNKHSIIITEKKTINPNVIHIVCSKPDGFTFTPGQAVKLYLNNDTINDESGAFTITSTPEQNNLEFIIKIYPSHKGFTDEVETYNVGEQLLMSDAYGYMKYKSSGMFIAAGSGITPFISIFKDLHNKGVLKGNRLIYANDNKESIILKEQLTSWFGDDFISILSQEKTDDHYYGLIDQDFLQNAIEDFTQDFYLCGPPEMMKTISNNLKKLGVSDSQITN